MSELGHITGSDSITSSAGNSNVGIVEQQRLARDVERALDSPPRIILRMSEADRRPGIFRSWVPLGSTGPDRPVSPRRGSGSRSHPRLSEDRKHPRVTWCDVYPWRIVDQGRLPVSSVWRGVSFRACVSGGKAARILIQIFRRKDRRCSILLSLPQSTARSRRYPPPTIVKVSSGRLGIRDEGSLDASMDLGRSMRLRLPS